MSVSQIRDRLASYDASLAQRFMRAADGFNRSSMSSEAVDNWARLCSEIASAGWHTWESALAYIDTCLELLEHAPATAGLEDETEPGTESILDCGKYGLNLAAIAHEPATGYFNSLREMLTEGKLENREKWQQTALIIHSNLSRGSILLTAYFTVSGAIVRQYSSAEFSCWIDLVASLVQPQSKSISEAPDRQAPEFLREFFAVCGHSTHKLPWSLVMKLPGKHLVQFLEIYPRIADWQEDDLSLVCELVNLLADREDDAADLLAALTGEIASVVPVEREYVLRTCLRLTTLEAMPVLAFLSSLDQLPLASPEKLEQWVGRGMELSRSGRPAANAYFGLESASSIEQLHAIKGQANFDEQQRLFHLYSEGITGRKFKIEAVVSEAEGYRDFSVAKTDGKHIFLPDQISVFPTIEENKTLYKLALLHQLGFFESGTFEYRNADSRNPFSDFFAQFEYPALASTLFQILEDGRVDWFLFRKYKGIRRELEWLMAVALQQRPVLEISKSVPGYWLEIIVQYTLGKTEFEFHGEAALGSKIIGIAATLNQPDSTVQDTTQAVEKIYALIAALNQPLQPEIPTLVEKQNEFIDEESKPELMADGWIPEPVDYRGTTRPEGVSLGMMMQELEDALADLMDDQGADGASQVIDPSSVKIEQFKRGDVKDAVGMFLTDLDVQADESTQTEELEDALEEIRKMLQMEGNTNREAGIFKYDEWDYQIQDYRKSWCKLHEIIPESDDELFVSETLEAHRPLLTQIKKQLQMLKPELQRKVKGLLDGEEIDLEGAIEAAIDRRAGISPTEKVYIQKLRKERDVSALFLLDMSASTDDVILDQASATSASEGAANKAPQKTEDEEDDFLSMFYADDVKVEPVKKRRIIDLEKESVVLMAEALEELGDNYAVHGFSGYGRDQVDYYVCKDFDERYLAEAKGRIGAIKPCRSTRMGPAIRHATWHLARTESRVKALIIISDGYPQDFDYGQDRNNKDYGIQDTTKALAEARQKGVQTFCLTVDQSGHDYLREMCPDQQYMVIQDIAQLPKELSKVYQGLTT